MGDTGNGTWGSRELGKHIDSLRTTLAEKINPYKRGFSPKLTAIVGAILEHDYGVRDGKGGKLGHISITSDGFVTVQSTASDGGGAFIGDARDFEQNIALLLDDVTLNDVERGEWTRLYSKNVTDWRVSR